ncbi:two-component sensor histidine kinase [Adhaeribacter aerolatus]|uniref:histidine kinase n=1 Tax=Adhaeribacter aerolatus TaxID=670289 RepID=A0A512B691_9BACT|nr:HAMP domain-containing sensor histidine kinase [Adhaeribacter aerolatus]GEO07472.1 two-component sensor histidine kinase [Adhaeribacter aerolatus]
MKLLNYTTAYFAGILLLVILVWAGLFYINMLDEIYDSMDDGLGNQKMLVMQKAARDSSVFERRNFEDGYYRLKEISFAQARNRNDVYQDTLMYVLNEQDYEPFRMLTTVFRHQDRFYELRVITSMVEEDDLIEDLFYALFWLYLGLIASILVLNNFLLKRIWRPFYKLLQRLQNFRLEDSSQFIPVPTTISEFQLLNNTVEKLLQKNISTYNSQKNFIENAAHELQTPLAISLNKLELLAESENLKDEQLTQIGAVIQNLERLTRLNKSLLLLSKIENKQFGPEAEVNLNELIGKIVADFSDQVTFRDLTVRVAEKEICWQKLNPDLAEILFINLVKNAIVHNKPEGFIEIIIQKDSVIIQNSGKPVPLDQDKLFTRFHKGSDAPGSTGLGLAIAKAIADLYQFRLTYEYPQMHQLTVKFK